MIEEIIQLDDKTGSENQAILSLKNIIKIYPGTVALKDVSLDIKKGEVHGIIGKNGAGKTTLVAIVAGLIKPTAGSIYIRNNEYKDLCRIVAKKEKISIVPQEPELVLECSIAENLFMPEYNPNGSKFIVNWNRLYEQARIVLQKGNLDLDPRSKVKDIGIGIQQILLILKASYVEKSEIIILDEASSSLSEEEEELFYQVINERKCEGCTILHISHRIDELLHVCDRLTVLRDGRSIKTVNREEVDKESLSSLIVGQDMAVNSPNRLESPRVVSAETGFAEEKEPLISVENISRINCFSDISFSVRKNEIVGLAGLRGSGRTEILKAIYGISPPESGIIKLKGKQVSFKHPAEALSNKIAYFPEKRDEEGLISNLSIRANMVLSALNRITDYLVINRKKENKLIKELADQLDLTYASFNQEVKELSGGNRQKVVAAKIISTQPEVYLLDEPTKGIDISAKEKLLETIKRDLVHNASVIMTAPGLDELIDTCDRILVLYKGKMIKEYAKADFNEEAIYKAIQGSHTAVSSI